VTSIEALEYVIERLSHETSLRPERQLPDVLQRKLDVIETLTALRDLIAERIQSA
jgi:hypothetical protein